MVKINYKILIIDIILLGVIILIVLFFQFKENDGVSADDDLTYCLKECELPQIHNYIIIDSAYEVSLSDEIRNLTLIISKSDYDTLLNVIKTKPYFKKYDSTDIPLNVYNVGSNQYKISEVAYLYKYQIFYGRYDLKIGEIISVTLKKDTILVIRREYLG